MQLDYISTDLKEIETPVNSAPDCLLISRGIWNTVKKQILRLDLGGCSVRLVVHHRNEPKLGFKHRDVQRHTPPLVTNVAEAMIWKCCMGSLAIPVTAKNERKTFMGAHMWIYVYFWVNLWLWQSMSQTLCISVLHKCRKASTTCRMICATKVSSIQQPLLEAYNS